MRIDYEQGVTVAVVGSTALTTAATTLATVTNTNYLAKSQFTLYINTAIPSGGNVTFHVYFSPDQGTTWYEQTSQSSASGDSVPLLVVVDSGSPTQDSGTSYRLKYDIDSSATTAVKVTAQTSTSTATLNSFTLIARDN